MVPPLSQAPVCRGQQCSALRVLQELLGRHWHPSEAPKPATIILPVPKSTICPLTHTLSPSCLSVCSFVPYPPTEVLINLPPPSICPKIHPLTSHGHSQSHLVTSSSTQPVPLLPIYPPIHLSTQRLHHPLTYPTSPTHPSIHPLIHP